nr:MAG TPA: IFab alpha, beta [Bacteriophage sp.]
MWLAKNHSACAWRSAREDLTLSPAIYRSVPAGIPNITYTETQ